MIVKQEAARIDGKLVDLQAENIRLKSSLSEMNIHAVDTKLKNEVYCIEQVLNELRVRADEADLQNEKIGKLVQLRGMVYDGSLDEVIKEIVAGDEMICYPISEMVLVKKQEWNRRIRKLEDEIEVRRVRYQRLDKEIKEFVNRKSESLLEEEEFGTRETRSDTFGCIPQGLNKNGPNGGLAGNLGSQSPADLQTTVATLLTKVFSELILEIESNQSKSNSE